MKEYQDMRDYTRKSPLFDSHEHFNGIKDLAAALPGYDFLNGVNGMVFAEIMAAAGTEFGRVSYDKLTEESVQRLLSAALTTGNGLALKLFAQDFLEMNEVSAHTLPELNERVRSLVNKYSASELYDYMCGNCGIRWIINDDYRYMPFNIESIETDFPDFVYNTVRLDPLLNPADSAELKETERAYDTAITSLQDLEDLLEKRIRCIAEYPGTVSLKSAMAYVRALDMKNPSRQDAETSFNLMLNGRVFDAGALMDYLLNKMFSLAGELDLPVQLHTGFNAGIYGDFRNGNPLPLIPTLQRHPDTKFVLFHSSWPFAEQLGALGKAFPNVWLDMSWSWNLSPLSMQQQLKNWLGSVPSNKITVFGGDGWTPVWSAASALLAKRCTADVLSELVNTDYFSRRDAEETADRLLYKNGLELYDIKEQKE
ncbi:MAG: amidohydrolase family protein [Spirochaetales bacterium]|nr:amidohydrolase family protein [Spirochaetales bacterium]